MTLKYFYKLNILFINAVTHIVQITIQKWTTGSYEYVKQCGYPTHLIIIDTG
ncbi:MAG TPA: hypothetical protein VGK46_13845 [Saprospiraceae bacterium]